MVICEKCHGDVEVESCGICKGDGYIIVWETTLKDAVTSGAVEQLHGKFKEEL
jgi:DnaJ-class molecular chaperone